MLATESVEGGDLAEAELCLAGVPAFEAVERGGLAEAEMCLAGVPAFEAVERGGLAEAEMCLAGVLASDAVEGGVVTMINVSRPERALLCIGVSFQEQRENLKLH